MNDYILFTHDDMDGAGCAIIFEYVLRSHSEVVHCTNANIDEKVLDALERGNINGFHADNILDDFDTIFFADICPSAEVLYRLKDRSVVICDHHITNNFAIDMSNQYKNITAKIIHERNGILESGTSILAETLIDIVGRSITNAFFLKLVDTIRSYDTYEWKKTDNKDAKRLQTLFCLMGLEEFERYYLVELVDYQNRSNEFPMPLPFNIIHNMYTFIVDNKIEQEQKAIDDFIENGIVYPIDLKGYKVAIALGTKGANISELAVQYLTKHPEFDIMGSYNTYDQTLSFRCIRDDINIGEEICAPIGGGGHPKAAGVSLTDGVKNSIVDIFSSFLNG